MKNMRRGMKVSDYIIKYLEKIGAKHVFIISGAGNMHLLNSLGKSEKLEYVCPHHEQAGVLASLAYTRISGRPGIMITTSGGGASNAITGVLDAWADSIPCMVISGQERTKFVKEQRQLRMWGVQGFDISTTVKNITKYSTLIDDHQKVRYELEKAFYIMNSGRPGPVWIDLPIDIQAININNVDELNGYVPEQKPIMNFKDKLHLIEADWKKSKRPVILLGNGIRLSGASNLIGQMMRKYKVPYLTAWNGADLIETNHPLHYGREGNYGQRSANFIIQNCDFLLAIGTRLAIPQVGYELGEFARQAKKFVVDIDESELSKFSKDQSFVSIQSDAKYFIAEMFNHIGEIDAPENWINICDGYRKKYPVYDKNLYISNSEFINSYTFINKLSHLMNEDEIIVTDMGTALTCTFQSIMLKKNQRIISSTGLGEMGYGLPGSVGACLANNKKRVVLIIGDGAMMMNLQELQTIIHHKLPVKIFLYCNDGYLSIRHTQMGLFGREFDAVGKVTGVSCPDFLKVGEAFGYEIFKVADLNGLDKTIQAVLDSESPCICEIPMDPSQPLVPKLSFSLANDGSMVSPPLEDLSPFLPREQLESAMLIGMHEKSSKVKV